MKTWQEEETDLVEKREDEDFNLSEYEEHKQ